LKPSPEPVSRKSLDLGRENFDPITSRLREIKELEDKIAGKTAKLEAEQAAKERKDKEALIAKRRKAAKEAFKAFQSAPDNSGLYGSSIPSYEHKTDDRFKE